MKTSAFYMKSEVFQQHVGVITLPLYVLDTARCINTAGQKLGELIILRKDPKPYVTDLQGMN
ncbi:MAG: hypothetical protein AB1553_01800 [Nitrospirota bacterium]